ncbi:MAG: hypothetical protein IPG53_10370 [Ignavibacteriales bacterium]|nr:hypothetical protein [Ignavibacteriales bacterium]
MKNLHNSDPYQKLIFVSNSDIPFDSTLAYEKAEELAGCLTPMPALGSINLLDGAIVDPPVVVFDLQTFMVLVDFCMLSKQNGWNSF